MRQPTLHLFTAILAFGAVVASTPAAYRLTDADPDVQSLTNIPLTGFNSFDPWLSTGTALRAAPFFDGNASAGIAHVGQPVFVPDPMTATQLTVGAGEGARFAPGDLVRVSRTGELLKVNSVIGDELNVTRGQFGSSAAALVDGDALTIATRCTSFVCWYFCEQPEDAPRSTVWELDRRSVPAATFALTLGRESGDWRFDAAVSGSATMSVTIPFDPRGRWLLVSLAHANLATEPADELLLTVFDPATQQTLTAAGELATPFSAALIPDSATIGDRLARGTGPRRSALGICIPAIVADVVADGRVLGSGIATVPASMLADGRGVSGHVTYQNFESCVWAANYSAGSFGGGDNDARAGIANGALHVFDRGRTYLNFRHQSDPGTSLYGGVTSVDPYLFGEGALRIARPAFDDRVSNIALPATAETIAELGGLHPSGLPALKTRRVAAALVDGAALDRLRLGILGNSRAVYPQVYPLRLSDGSFPGRLCRSNFVDMGVVGQAPLYGNGLLVGHIGPVPWCNWSEPNQTSGAYGVDCSAELPRCVANPDTSPVVVPPSVAMESLLDSTLGSRFGIFSPKPSRVPSVGFPAPESQGSLDNYRGNHDCIRLKPAHSVRFLVRPEAGLPESDPLVVTLYVQNHPSSSSLRARAVRSTSQGGPETWSEAIAVPTLGALSDAAPPARKVVTSVIVPRLPSPFEHARKGSVTVSDADGAFAQVRVGDMVQLFDPAGVSAVYNEAFAVSEVTRFANGNLRLAYDWLPRQFPAPGDSITFIKGEEILKKVQIEIPPCPADEWRGIEVTADVEGDGVLLWGFGFENPARNGIVTVPIGRSGCGAWIQYNRWPVQAPPGGRSLLQRIFDELDLDVAVLTTADQGTPGGFHLRSYERIIDTFRFDSPETELVIYATGPEYASEETLNKADAFDKFSVFASMQLAAANKQVPMTSFFFDESRRSSAFGRVESGVDTTESATHPGTVLDVTMLAEQLLALPAAPPVIQPVSVLVCPSGTATFSVDASPETQLQYSWEWQRPDGAYATLADGTLEWNGAVVATVSGATTHAITLSGFDLWQGAGWPNPGRSALRCTETRPSGTLTSVPADFSVCPTDLDCSFGTDGDDVLVFFGWWDQSDIRADFNGDSAVDGDDVIDFFARWDAGC
ncbi:MAG: hypothetical protein ACOYN0_05600 [Phycisphaerales bacterium]